MSRATESDLVRKLEGEYFAFSWTDHDINHEGSCIAIYQLKNGRLEGIIGYYRYAEEMEAFGDRIDEEVINYLKSNNIAEVYSLVAHPNEAMGIVFYEDNPEELDEEGAVNEWSGLELLSVDHEDLLKREGIKILGVNYGTGEI